jgi:hypothetical protein
MRVDIEKITGAINKITDIVAGDKAIPGVLLDLSDDELKVCFTNGHKSLIEKIAVTNEEGDHKGGIVVDFAQISRAIANCQPSGLIKVSEVVFIYNEATKVVVVSADQNFEIKDDEGNVSGYKKMATKNMDLLWAEPGSDMKTAILTRMKYEDIFEAETVDELDRKEFIKALSKTSTEKGKQLYISRATQTMFVANQAHCTSVPISKKAKLSDDEINEIKSELLAEKSYTDDAELNRDILKAIANAENRIHFSVALTQAMAKSIIGILNKTKSDTVYLHTNDKYCNIYIQNEDETVGIWFEMATVSKAHTNVLERYNSLPYRNYHAMFMREFLDNNVKSALSVTKSDKIVIKFIKSDNFTYPALVIAAGSDSASVSDNYTVEPNSLIDEAGDITERQFTISLKVLADMLAQLDTMYVAFDINIATNEDGTVSTSLRLSEIDTELLVNNYKEARERTKLLCEQQGINFVADGEGATPTPATILYELRDKELLTKQFTMLAK